MKTVCLFGSSFNPPHIGHVQIVEGLKTKNFDQLLIVPTGVPNHKQINISEEDRIALIEAFAKVCDVDISYHEIENQFSYTVESLQYLNYDNKTTVYFVIGADSLNNLQTWDYYDELIKMVTFIIVNRSHYPLDESILKQINYQLLDVTTADISSSALREKLDEKYIPKPIMDVIINRKLY